jgi:hypothetical protein
LTPPAAASAAQRLRPSPARPARPARPPHPRRVSGPARRPASRATGAIATPQPLVVVAGDAVRGLARSLANGRTLDRLVASKAWIGLVAFALIGIVTLQLLLLELNTGVGRALQRTDYLQRQNAALSITNSELAAGDRVQAQSLTLGMEAAAPVSLRFLPVDPHSDVARAAAALATPVKPPEAQASEQTSQTTEGSSQAESGGGSEAGSEAAASGSSASGASQEGSGESSGAPATESRAGAEAATGSGPSG